MYIYTHTITNPNIALRKHCPVARTLQYCASLHRKAQNFKSNTSDVLNYRLLKSSIKR